MNTVCKEFVNYIVESAPKHNKQSVENAVCQKYRLIKDRKVFHNEYFAVRFSYSKSDSESFSNTVLSLSALEKYDSIPFFVVLVRQNSDNLILLSNTTFLKKVSHSSQELSTTNIRGSFNGSDIMREYNGLRNSPTHFDELFCIHQGFDWNDDLIRLVDATSKIKPVSEKFVPSDSELSNIFNSIDRAKKFISSTNFKVLEDDLNTRCEKCKNEILIAQRIENTNIRGRLIESLITSDDEQRADSRSVFLFFFIGLDENSIFKTLLCSVYHSKLVDNVILQPHWAGRSTRGATQFSGTAIDAMLQESSYINHIDHTKCENFLQSLLDR